MAGIAPHTVALAVASLGLLACGSVAGGPARSAAPASPHDRPLQLPAVAQGASCPVSPQVRVPPGPGGVYPKPIPAYAFGKGPAYLSGQLSWYAGPPGQAALVLVDGTYTGRILIRARALGGGGAITLAPQDIPPEHRLPTMLPPGTATADGVEAAVPTGTSGWSEWLGHLTVGAPGCYGVQVDGDSFTSVIVFAVQAGPIPPG